MKYDIDAFFSSEAFAVIGVSRNRNKFGNTIFREMKKRNNAVYPVNQKLTAIEGVNCYANVTDLPETVGSAVLVVHPENTLEIIKACEARGIVNIWLQQGAESDGAIAYAKEHGLNLVHGRCVLMFLEPVKSYHALHRWVNKVVGAYPA